MINVIELNYKEKEYDFDSPELLKKSKNYLLGLHVWNSFTEFYVKLGDLFNTFYWSWCNDNISLPNVKCYNPKKANYNGRLQTENIIKDCEELNLKCPACDYCVSKGGYLGTLEQYRLLLPKLNIFPLVWSSSPEDNNLYSIAISSHTDIYSSRTNHFGVIPLYDKLKREEI